MSLPDHSVPAPVRAPAPAPVTGSLGTAEAPAHHDHGPLAEDLRVPERLIAAPVAGTFSLLPPDVITSEGEIVRAGQQLGEIERNAGTVPVVSPHTGFLMGLLALPGERVRHGQPLAWVRVLS
jgi:biotin carboxyl carrier protein